MDTLSLALDTPALSKLGGDSSITVEGSADVTVTWEPGDMTRYVVSVRQVHPLAAQQICGNDLGPAWQITLWGRSEPWLGTCFMTFPGCSGVSSEDVGERLKCNPHTARVVAVIANTAVQEFDRQGQATVMDIQSLRLNYPDAPGFAARYHIA